MDNEIEVSESSAKEDSYYEYKSKTKILGIPLVHIHYSHKYLMTPYDLRRQRLKTAKGIIAIGDRSIGVLSIGLFSLGIFNIGLFGAGLIGLTIVQCAIFSFGIIALGFSTVGIISIGFYALGVIALAKEVAVGVVAVGNNSFGVVASGKDLVVSLENLHKRSLCDVNPPQYDDVVQFINKRWLPQPLKFFLEIIIKC